jgi:ribosomal protein L11 methyltransferase
MAYLALSFALTGLDPEVAEAVCFDAGALCVTFSDAQHDPLRAHAGDAGAVLEPQRGEVRLWRDTEVQVLYDAEHAEPALLARLAAALGIDSARLRAHSLPDRVWEREWLRDFHALQFGQRLWVCPRHESVTQGDAVVVRLDPGLAFGTGSHPSTAMCLEWLDGAALHGREVIDYGCGSGVLAIAALKLGARRAYAYDHDPQALLATRDNAADNAVAQRLVLCELPAQLPAHCDVLLANILSESLLALRAELTARVLQGGVLLLSGLLYAQEAEVAACYAACFDMKLRMRRDGWSTLQGLRR